MIKYWKEENIKPGEDIKVWAEINNYHLDKITKQNPGIGLMWETYSYPVPRGYGHYDKDLYTIQIYDEKKKIV